MPERAPRPCRVPTCPNLTRDRSGFCEEHKRQELASRDRQRETAATRGYCSRAWRRLRRIILNRDPICRECGVAPATDVDHVVPRSQGGQDAEDNLQGLCASCHARKTAREDGGFGNARRTDGQGREAGRRQG